MSKKKRLKKVKKGMEEACRSLEKDVESVVVLVGLRNKDGTIFLSQNQGEWATGSLSVLHLAEVYKKDLRR